MRSSLPPLSPGEQCASLPGWNPWGPLTPRWGPSARPPPSRQAQGAHSWGAAAPRPSASQKPSHFCPPSWLGPHPPGLPCGPAVCCRPQSHLCALQGLGANSPWACSSCPLDLDVTSASRSPQDLLGVLVHRLPLPTRLWTPGHQPVVEHAVQQPPSPLPPGRGPRCAHSSHLSPVSCP